MSGTSIWHRARDLIAPGTLRRIVEMLADEKQSPAGVRRALSAAFADLFRNAQRPPADVVADYLVALALRQWAWSASELESPPDC